MYNNTMSNENREEILADFQACTGIDDVTKAISHLDETNWNLQQAVNNVISLADHQANHEEPVVVDEDSAPSNGNAATCDPDVIIVNDTFINVPSTSLMDNSREQNHFDNVQPSTSFDKYEFARYYFKVHYGERIISVDFPPTATVCELKRYLHKELQIPPCRQILSAWARMAQFEKTPFGKLMLPNENILTLTKKRNSTDGLGSENESELADKLASTYTLNIELPDMIRRFKYLGTSTIQKVKNDLSDVTGIQVRNQIWTGWPLNTNADTMLAIAGIEYPEHFLTLKENKASLSNSRSYEDDIVQVDSDDEEYEDASESFNIDDDYFADTPFCSKRTQPLIPENVDEEIVGSISFTEQFTTRYGPIHPAFFQGTLEEAVKEACHKSAADRKILAIYLHHDDSVLTNVFCTQLLGYESVMQVFANNFVLWGWDLTFDSNRSRFYAAISSTLGTIAAQSLRHMPVERLPALVIIMKKRSSIDICNVIHGNVGINELLSALIEAAEEFTQQQSVEVVEEEARAEREQVKLEQDQAFHESLAADKAKEAARLAQEAAASMQRQQRETEMAEEMARREQRRLRIEASLPAEPNASQTVDVTQVRVRLPNGNYIERRFCLQNKLAVLFDFLTVKGYPHEEFKVIATWPRRDLTSLNFDKALRELNFCAQESVILEER